MSTASAGGRSEATRAALLQAAREVFSEDGYTEASIADVVSRARASVGSLYHHFGGKADIFFALFEEYQGRQESRVTMMVRAAREAGQTDPLELFLVGARAYLRGCWSDRYFARLFLFGDGPPGFDLTARRRFRAWMERNARLLRAESGPLDDVLILALTTVTAEGAREIAMMESESDAMRFADEIVTLIARIGWSR